MDKDQQERSKILLKAAFEILVKCDDAPYVLDAMCATTIWDGVECDGHCLMEELGELLESINKTEQKDGS